jgi:hypothetical protein
MPLGTFTKLVITISVFVSLKQHGWPVRTRDLFNMQHSATLLDVPTLNLTNKVNAENIGRTAPRSKTLFYLMIISK